MGPCGLPDFGAYYQAGVSKVNQLIFDTIGTAWLIVAVIVMLAFIWAEFVVKIRREGVKYICKKCAYHTMFQTPVCPLCGSHNFAEITVCRNFKDNPELCETCASKGTHCVHGNVYAAKGVQK
jgi:predicted RNA-binding Zn-ribbon protein involved in translation (DUF1610 family)